jgi:hypothetical protein
MPFTLVEHPEHLANDSVSSHLHGTYRPLREQRDQEPEW